MGQDKLLLPWQGKPLLQHVIDTAAASPLSPLLLVLDPANTSLARRIATGPCRIIACHGTVYSDSLRAGLAALDEDCDGAMFLLGDQPLVTGGTLAALIRSFQAEPRRWVAPAWQGRRGNPVIAPRIWFDRISALEGDTGPRGYLKDPETRLQLVTVKDEGVVLDIDRPEEYRKLLGRKQ